MFALVVAVISTIGAAWKPSSGTSPTHSVSMHQSMNLYGFGNQQAPLSSSIPPGAEGWDVTSGGNRPEADYGGNRGGASGGDRTGGRLSTPQERGSSRSYRGGWDGGSVGSGTSGAHGGADASGRSPDYSMGTTHPPAAESRGYDLVPYDLSQTVTVADLSDHKFVDAATFFVTVTCPRIGSSKSCERT